MQTFCTFRLDYYDFSSDYATLNNDMPFSFPHKHEKPITDCYPSDIPKIPKIGNLQYIGNSRPFFSCSPRNHPKSELALTEDSENS